MQTLEAVMQIVTPMFSRGADDKATTAELRSQSVKGMIRFWYRATVLAKYGTWQKVQEVERIVFGSSDTGQGIFQLTVDDSNVKSAFERNDSEILKAGCAYLGYGPVTYEKEIKKNQITRPYLKADGSFTVKLFFRFRPGDEQHEEHIQDIQTALKAWGLLGGMGARSRRGFGSVCLDKLIYEKKVIWEKPKKIEELRKEIGTLLQTCSTTLPQLPPYSALSSRSKVALVVKGKQALDVLHEVGSEMIRYRSFGIDPQNTGIRRLPGLKEEQRNPSFTRDHTWMCNVKDNEIITELPERLIFGLPSGYKYNIWIGQQSRRSSPLFIHIQPIGNEYIAVLTMLPAVFWNDSEILVEQGRRKVAALSGATVQNFEVIETFMNRLIKRFPNESTIMPQSRKENV